MTERKKLKKQAAGKKLKRDIIMTVVIIIVFVITVWKIGESSIMVNIDKFRIDIIRAPQTNFMQEIRFMNKEIISKTIKCIIIQEDTYIDNGTWKAEVITENIPALSENGKYVLVATNKIKRIHRSQAANYMKATGRPDPIIHSETLSVILYDNKGRTVLNSDLNAYEVFKGDIKYSQSCLRVTDDGTSVFIVEQTELCDRKCPNKLYLYRNESLKMTYPIINEFYIYDCYSIRFSPNSRYFSVSTQEDTWIFDLESGRKWKTDYGKPVEILYLTNKGGMQMIDSNTPK